MLDHVSSNSRFLTNRHIVFHMAVPICITTNSIQERVPLSLHPPQNLFFVFKIAAILTRLRRYLTVILIHISLMISGVEHFSMYFLAVYISSLKTYLFRSFAQFLTRLFVLFAIVSSSLDTLEINPLSDE